MDSLYGGHQGISFVLKAAFHSISDMVKAFKGGPNYTDVWYGEFCIIDTPNKNDKDNGKIYERGYNYQNDMGGAIYKGQVVGPSSGTPYFAMDSIDAVTKISEKDISKNPYTYRRFPVITDQYPTGKDENGNYITAANGNIATFDFGKPDVLVPGKDENGNFNDNIKYTWCNIREDNADSDSWFYVGWQIPYLTVDYDIHTNSPYNAQGVREDKSTIVRKDDKTHPFYEQWGIGVPHGIKGDAIRNLKVITPQANEKIYPWTALTINDKGVATIDTNAGNYEGYNDDVAKGHQIVVFDYYAFDQQINPSPYRIYVGDFNVVKSVKVSDNGTLTISYTSKDNDVQNNLVKWVNSVSLSTEVGTNGGKFVVTYNNGSAPYEADLEWIKDITIDNNGDVTYTYVGRDKVIETAKLKWLDDITLDEDNGHMSIVFNNTAFDKHDYYLKWVKDINIAEDGTITLSYTGGKNNRVLNSKLKNITSATISDDGVITFTYNTKTGEKYDTANLKKSTTNGLIDFKLPWITNVTLGTGISEDKHIQIKYNNKPNAESIGAPINFVQNMIVRPSDWHLLVLFNDPTHRYSPKTNELSGTWVNGGSLKSLNTDPNNPIIPIDEVIDGIYWRDYGPIKDQAGILVGFNLTYEMVATSAYDTALDWLNGNLPSGLTGEQNVYGGSSTRGKVVAYTPQKTQLNPNPGCEFYAFDYQSSENGGYHWFYLGTISDDGMRDIGLLAPGAALDTIFEKVNTKGLVFKQNSIAVGDALDQFWAIDYVK